MADPILIVDDEKDNLSALNRLLRNQYEMTLCESPFEALKEIRKKNYHVIVSDQRMPEMTGVEFLEKAKAVAPESVRILLTGYTDVDSVINAINRGNIYRYVAKPWDPEDLKLTIKQANEAYLLRQEIESKNRELLSTNQNLTRALENLKALDKAKGRFLSLVSHELNTPLTVLTSFVSLLSDEKSELNRDLQKAVESVENASDRFSEIIREVLSFVRVESESLEIEEGVSFRELIAQSVSQIEKQIQSKKVKIETRGNANCRCDSKKMRLAIECLLKESLNRSHKNSTIVFELDDKNDVSLSVTRTGEILSSEALNVLETAKDVMTHSRNLGLSLAIARVVAELHGGKLELVRSDSTSTQLRLTLPK